MNKRDWARLGRDWPRLFFSGMVAILLSIYAMTVHAYGVTECAASRFGSNLNCTANDVALNSITIAGSAPASCIGGATLPLDLDVTINFQNPSRYDIGVFLSNDGKSPQFLPPTGASSCSVGILPLSSPFQNLDGDLCGDGGGGLTGTFRMFSVAVPCTTDGSGNFSLFIPYVISWDQQSGNYCGNNSYPVPGATSKCNSGSVIFPPGMTIVVLPAISITDGVTTAKSGDTLTYTVVITNTTGSSLINAVFSDPAVANLSVSSVSCTAAGGATCPVSPTVAAMQGAGITLPTMPNNSTLTFTVIGTVGAITSQTTLTNTARVSVSGQTNSASDADTLYAPPVVAKSFSPVAIAPSGVATLTITLTNNNSTAITGLAFTDSYPSGMTNSAVPTLTNSCGGTPTAAAGGASLSLSGGSIAANSSCAVTVRVVATITGLNSTGTITTTNVGSRSATSATLQVVSAGNSTVVANPTSVPDDGVSISTITVTLKDTAGNPVVGKAITLTAGSGSSTITTINGTTDAAGQAIFTVKDAVAESVTYTARDVTDGVTITQTATVNFSSVGSFNAFESATAAGSVSGRIYTKLAGAAFSLDVIAISGSSQASGFNNNVKVELLANTGTVGSGYGANNCPTSSAVIQTIASATITGGRSTVNFAAVANAYQDVRVRISYPTTSPTITTCSNDSFAIRPSALTLLTNANAMAPSASATPIIKAGTAFTLYAITSTGTNYNGTLALDGTRLTAQTTTQATTVQSGGTVGTLTPVTLIANPSPLPSNNASYSEVGYLYLGAGAYRDDTYTIVDQPSDCISGSSDDVFTGGRIGCSIGNRTTVSLGRFIPDHFGLTTRGSINAGSNSLVVDSVNGISAGMTISILGAGAAGGPLDATVALVAGTTLTLSSTAVTSVSNTSVVLSTLQTRADLAATGSSFTYMDEPMKLTLKVIAYNATEGVTQNYSGSYAKLDAVVLGSGGNWFNTGCAAPTQCFGLGAVNGITGLSNRLAIDTSLASPSSLWTAGIGSFVSHVKFIRNATPDGPYLMLKIGAMPSDGDGVSLPGPASADNHKVDFDATAGNNLASNPDGSNERRLLFTTDLRFGRLWAGSAYGTEKRNITIPYETQYWNGVAFVKNTMDNSNPLALANLGLGNYQGGVTSANLPVSAISLGTFSAGGGSITLAAPNAAGSVCLVAKMNTPLNMCPTWAPGFASGTPITASYLRGKWCGSNYDRDPSICATFGVFGSSLKKGPIYLRENH